MPAAALAIPAVIGGVTSIFGAKKQSDAAKNAGTVQANAAKDTIDYTNARLKEGDNAIDTATGTASNWTAAAADNVDKLMSPYIHGGEAAEGQLTDLLGAPVDKFSYDPSKVADDPGYKFTLAQGMKALEQSAAARGQSLSGGQLKAINQFGEGNAATFENQFYNQALQTFDTNRDTTQQRIANLFGQTSQGLNAGQFAGNTRVQTSEYSSTAEQNGAALKAKLGLDAAGQVGNARTGGANSTAASILGSSTAMTNGIKTAGDDLGQAIFLNQVMNQGKPKAPIDTGPDRTGYGDDAQFGG